MKLPAIMLIVLIANPPATQAQSVAPALFRADTAASIGWFAADRTEPGTCCGGWSSSFFKGVGGGYYWTDHLKTEVDISWPGTTQAFTYPNRPATSDSPLIYDDHSYTTLKVSASQLYQFGQNAVVHPFVGIGLDVDRDRDEITRTTQVGRTFSEIHLTEHETHVRPFLTTGIKAYFSERTFFRTDVRVGFSDQLDQFVWRSGIGVDLGQSPARAQRSTQASTPAPSRQPESGHRETPELWHSYAAKLPIGSVVRVSSRGGQRFVGSLMAVDDTGVMVKPRSRVTEPARHISFDDLEQLDLYEGGTSVNRAGAIAAGMGAAVGVFFLSVLAVLATID
jgi:hypothetical protein